MLENILRSHVSPNPNHFAQFHSRSQDMYVGFVKCSFHLCNFFIGILKLTLGSRVTGLKERENKFSISQEPCAAMCGVVLASLKPERAENNPAFRKAAQVYVLVSAHEEV